MKAWLPIASQRGDVGVGRACGLRLRSQCPYRLRRAQARPRRAERARARLCWSCIGRPSSFSPSVSARLSNPVRQATPRWPGDHPEGSPDLFGPPGVLRPDPSQLRLRARAAGSGLDAGGRGARRRSSFGVAHAGQPRHSSSVMVAEGARRATVGRGAELETIHALVAALSDGPRALFLRGPPGNRQDAALGRGGRTGAKAGATCADDSACGSGRTDRVRWAP